MAHRSWKDGSRLDYWSETSENSGLCAEQVRTGAILRIADAAEKMALNHSLLIDERDRYKKFFNESIAERGRLERSNAALRGAITRLRRQKEELVRTIHQLGPRKP